MKNIGEFAILCLKILHKIYSFAPWVTLMPRPESIRDPNIVAEILYNALLNDSPCMITRFGANELACLVNFVHVTGSKRNVLKYITGKQPQWWWNENVIKKMHEGAGFFPPDVEAIKKFCELTLEDIPEVDVLGSWLSNEHYFKDEISHTQKVQLLTLDPYWAKNPWTRALKGKKVLVVHPFAETIKKQYEKRSQLFENDILPDFELSTVKAVQSIAGTKTPFSDWFDALEFMKNQIDQIDYDICLIGAGAYGLSLAAHVKRSGKKGFHMGGSLQLLFGIRGRRWESDSYKVNYRYDGKEIFLDYSSLVNEFWVRPDIDEKPTNANVVEDGCYW